MQDDIKKTLWATVDKLRANRDAAEYKHLVLGLIFVKYMLMVRLFQPPVLEIAGCDSK
jgi:type I restriction-modification system DNA methylase subunit